MRKIVKKFMKEHFEAKDNIIDKNILQIISKSCVSNRKQLHYAIDDMVFFFSIHFTGSKQLARYHLEDYTTQVRHKDVVGVSFWGGTSILMVVLAVFLLCTPASDGSEMTLASIAFSVIKCCFMMVYCVLGAAFCTHIFSLYGINHLFIFEIDPNFKMTFLTLYRIAVTLFFFWIFFVTLAIAHQKMTYLFSDSPLYALAFLFIFFVLYCL